MPAYLNDMKAFAQRVFVAGVVIGAIVLTAYIMQWLLLILGGVLMAILFRSAAEWLSGRTKLPLRWATVIVLGITGALALGLTWEFGAKIAGEADQLILRLSQALKSLQQQAQHYAALERVLSRSNLNLEEPTETLLSGAIWTAAAVVLVLFVGVYVCVNPGMYVRGLIRFFPESKHGEIQGVLTEIGSALKWWVFGQLVAMAAVGVITAVGLLIVGIPMALPLALVAGVLTFVPYVGAIVSAVPALMVAFTVSTSSAVWVGVVFLIAHVVEGYIVVPGIQHRFVSLPPALILANQFLMELLVGTVGIALATPFLVVVMVLIKRLYFHKRWDEDRKAA